MQVGRSYRYCADKPCFLLQERDYLTLLDEVDLLTKSDTFLVLDVFREESWFVWCEIVTNKGSVGYIVARDNDDKSIYFEEVEK